MSIEGAATPRVAGPPAFHLLAKPTGATCNLDCEYCFFLSKEMLFPGLKAGLTVGRLDEAVLRAAPRRFKAFFHRVDQPLRMMSDLLLRHAPPSDLMHSNQTADQETGR